MLVNVPNWRVMIGKRVYQHSIPFEQASIIVQRLEGTVLNVKLERLTSIRELMQECG